MTAMKLILHKLTDNQIKKFLSSPSHALLLEGAAGSGKGAVAAHIAANLLKIDAEKLESYPYVLKVVPENKVISIETVRLIQKFMNLKTVGTNPIRRILMMEDAETMTTEAQNALLKLLEEPPADTVLILTSQLHHSLLPTIYSRLQKISVKAPDKDELRSFFEAAGFAPKDFDRAYFISEGQAGLLHALLSEDTTHSLNNSISEAKQLASSTVFERLASVDRLAKRKEQIPELLYALERIYKSVLVGASEKNNDRMVKQSHQALKLILKAQSKLTHNPNAKLLLTDLFLNI